MHVIYSTVHDCVIAALLYDRLALDWGKWSLLHNKCIKEQSLTELGPPMPQWGVLNAHFVHQSNIDSVIENGMHSTQT